MLYGILYCSYYRSPRLFHLIIYEPASVVRPLYFVRLHSDHVTLVIIGMLLFFLALFLHQDTMRRNYKRDS